MDAATQVLSSAVEEFDFNFITRIKTEKDIFDTFGFFYSEEENSDAFRNDYVGLEEEHHHHHHHHHHHQPSPSPPSSLWLSRQPSLVWSTGESDGVVTPPAVAHEGVQSLAYSSLFDVSDDFNDDWIDWRPFVVTSSASVVERASSYVTTPPPMSSSLPELETSRRAADGTVSTVCLTEKFRGGRRKDESVSPAERKRRDRHNNVEKRRRNEIGRRLEELEAVIPPEMRPNDRSKKSLLEAGLKAKTAIKNEIEILQMMIDEQKRIITRRCHSISSSS